MISAKGASHSVSSNLGPPMPRPLILASASPRRLELLAQIGIVPEQVIAADIDETPMPNERPKDYVLRMARKKHEAVASDFPDHYCLAADTVVSLGLRILGKPKIESEARQFLSALSGRRHRVITAIAVSAPKKPPRIRYAKSTVKFARLDSAQLDSYIKTGEWQDKAGGYAIQGQAARHIQWIEGSYSAIMGLPCFEATQLLRGLGYFKKD